MDEVYEIAGSLKLWSVVRQVSGIKEKEADSLAPALTEMLVRGKEVMFNRHLRRYAVFLRDAHVGRLYGKS